MKIQLSVFAALALLSTVQGQGQQSPKKQFFIPLPETSVFYDALREINSANEWRSSNKRVRGDMVSLISMAIGFDGTVVWYDHWEDGT